MNAKNSTGTPTQCNPASSFAATSIDGLVANTVINTSAVSYQYVANGKYVGTSYTPIYGDKITVLASLSGYLPNEQTVVSAVCGPNPVQFAFKSYDNATITIKQDAKNGASALTNDIAGGTVNATAITSGGSTSLPVLIEGNTQKTTGKIFMVVELPTGSASNVSSASFNGGSQVSSIPTCLSSSNANSYRVAYEIPASDGYTSNTYNLAISTNAGKILEGGVRTTYYAEKKFVDADGQVKEGVCDSNNNAVYQDMYSYNFLLK